MITLLLNSFSAESQLLEASSFMLGKDYTLLNRLNSYGIAARKNISLHKTIVTPALLPD